MAHNQHDHLERGGVASAMNVALVVCSTEHRPLDVANPKLWRNRHMTPVAGDGVTHKDLCIHPV